MVMTAKKMPVGSAPWPGIATTTRSTGSGLGAVRKPWPSTPASIRTR